MTYNRQSTATDAVENEQMETAPPRRNIELKARLASIDRAREIARSVATEYLGQQTQIDTYFRCCQGRLKLRQSDQVGAQLVAYQREDLADAKPSDYRLLDVAEPEQLREMLAETLGIECVVEKRREVFMYHNVRIHLDEVTELGIFLEFEAVLGDQTDDEQGRSQIAYLSKAFKIGASDLLCSSYSDMVDRLAGGISGSGDRSGPETDVNARGLSPGQSGD